MSEMWTVFLQRVKTATLGQVRKIPAGIRKAIMFKAVRHCLTGLGGALGAIGWHDSAWLTSAGAAAFIAGIALSVLDAYLVDEKINTAAALGSA